MIKELWESGLTDEEIVTEAMRRTGMAEAEVRWILAIVRGDTHGDEYFE